MIPNFTIWNLSTRLHAGILNALRCCKDMHTLTPPYLMLQRVLKRTSALPVQERWHNPPHTTSLRGKHLVLIFPDPPSTLWPSVKHFTFTFRYIISSPTASQLSKSSNHLTQPVRKVLFQFLPCRGLCSQRGLQVLYLPQKGPGSRGDTLAQFLVPALCFLESLKSQIKYN